MTRLLLSLLALGTALAAVLLSRPKAPEAPGIAEARIRDANLEFYAARADRDPRGSLDLARLSALFNDRARATGNLVDLLEAERTARRSLGNRRDNPPALRALAASLLGQHRFEEARVCAERLIALDPDDIAARALKAEILMELGHYAEARLAFESLVPHSELLPVAPRLAKWSELTGDPGSARALLRRARATASRTYGVTAGSLAWFDLQLGALALRHGRLDEAGRNLARGLLLTPDDPRLLEVSAQVEAARGRWSVVERLVHDALGAGGTDPGLLLLLADVAHARRQFRLEDSLTARAEAAALAVPGPVHRDVALGLLDRRRAIAEILSRAEAELDLRQDVYGWEVYAWALRAAGREEPARLAMQRALELGTTDPRLLAHAAALGVRVGSGHGL
ncbi:MAG: tetratricopeptide repeat protein [Gemmatimonadales bacterium]